MGGEKEKGNALYFGVFWSGHVIKSPQAFIRWGYKSGIHGQRAKGANC